MFARPKSAMERPTKSPKLPDRDSKNLQQVNATVSLGKQTPARKRRYAIGRVSRLQQRRKAGVLPEKRGPLRVGRTG